MIVTRGDIFIAQLDPTMGKEIQKTRPVIILSNDVNNTHSDLVTVVPITSQQLAKVYPFEVLLPQNTAGLLKPSKAKANQIRTIDKIRLTKKVGRLNANAIAELNRAVRVHLDL